MRSAGRLIEPVLAARWRGEASLPGRLVAWSRERAGASATSHVLASLGKTYVKDFTQGGFLAASLADVRAVLSALSSGPAAAAPALARLSCLSEHMQALLERGADESRAAAGGASQCADVEQVLEEPSITQARFVFPTAREAAPTFNPRPTHAQLTVRFRLLLRPFALLPEAAVAAASGGGGGGSSSSSSAAAAGSHTRRPRAPAAALAPSAAAAAAASGAASDGSMAATLRARRPVEWEPVLDERTRCVYWVAAAGSPAPLLGYAALPSPAGGSWLRSWEAPPPAATLPQRPFRLELAGAEREPVLPSDELAVLLGGGGGGGAPAPLVRITLLATWERAIPPAGSLNEGRAASAATERWRLVKMW